MRNHETSIWILLLNAELVESIACGNAELQFLLLILIGTYQLHFKGLSMCCIISDLSKELVTKCYASHFLTFAIFLFQIYYIWIRCLNIFTTAEPSVGSKCRNLTV